MRTLSHEDAMKVIKIAQLEAELSDFPYLRKTEVGLIECVADRGPQLLGSAYKVKMRWSHAFKLDNKPITMSSIVRQLMGRTS